MLGNSEDSEGKELEAGNVGIVEGLECSKVGKLEDTV
jgi:hypothetical protein